MNSFRLAFVQYAACSVFSLAVAALVETATTEGLLKALPAVFYGGVLSVGVAYTLQVIGQRRAHPAHASILLSLESVFAALGGGSGSRRCSLSGSWAAAPSCFRG